MVAVEDDRTLAADVADRAAHPIDEDALNDRNAGELDNRLHIYGRLLASERKESPRSSTSQLVPDFSTFW